MFPLRPTPVARLYWFTSSQLVSTISPVPLNSNKEQEEGGKLGSEASQARSVDESLRHNQIPPLPWPDTYTPFPGNSS